MKMTTGEPKTEAEFLSRESQLARAALLGLRGEIAASLSRTSDVAAWTERYPWGSLGTAAAGGLAAGGVVGKAIRHTPKSTGEPERRHSETHPDSAAHATAQPAGRLVSGLGTLASAALSAAAAAATEAMGEIIKSSIHEAMRPNETPRA
ncbi:MAG: hypothetical protein IT427_14245 [Pirellulales bacterium]|nr:hypothetical protein [Pirellulales bacterium]